MIILRMLIHDGHTHVQQGCDQSASKGLGAKDHRFALSILSLKILV